MTKNIKKIIKAVIIFLIVWVGGSLTSVVLEINNGLLPALFLGAAIAIWYYKTK